MEQSVVTILVALGGAAVGVAVIAAGYVMLRAWTKARSTAPAAVEERPRTVAQRVADLHRTRRVLLGWLDLLEALDRSDIKSARAARARLGDFEECRFSLVGDTALAGAYLATAAKLKSRIGRGLSARLASELESLRADLQTTLAMQQVRISSGDQPLEIEPPSNPDFFEFPGLR